MSTSLHSRLMFGIGMTTSLLLIVSAYGISLLVHRGLIQEFDKSLLQKAHTLKSLVDMEDGLVHSEISENEPPQFHREERPDYYQIWDDTGVALERSSRLDGENLTRDQLKGQVSLRSATLIDGRPGRVVFLEFVPNVDVDDEEEDEDGERNDESGGVAATMPLTIAIACDVVDMNETYQGIRRALLMVFGLAIVLTLATTSIVVRMGLQPLNESAKEIAKIDDASLSRRINVARVPTEVRIVVERMNSLLDRLENAFRRERAFSSNLAHELRTPLAGLHSIIEVSLAQPRDADDYQQTLATGLSICVSMEDLTERLLVLGRLEAGAELSQTETLDLSVVARETWNTQFSDATSVSWSVDEPIEVHLDKAMLTIVLRNLFENAMEYRSEGTKITAKIGVQAELATVCIQNRCDELTNDTASRAADRFWRSDNSRTQVGHFGLGLSICREAVEALNGKLDISTNDSVFCATVTLPLQPR